MSLARLLAACLLWLHALLGFAAGEPIPIPPLSARVTDLTGTLPADCKAALEERLAGFEAAKGSQVAVLVLPTTGPETIEQFGIRLMDAWKIGRKGVDDGAILIVARDDRRLRIEVGYGLEGVLNDAKAKAIIAETITPKFKAGDLPGGIEAGVEAILKTVDREVLPAADTRTDALSGEPQPEGYLNIEDMGPTTLTVGLGLVVFGGAILRFFLGNLLGSALVAVVTGGIGWLFSATLAGLLIGAAIGFFLALFGLEILLNGGSGSGSGSSSSSGGFSGGGGSGGGGGASGSW